MSSAPLSPSLRAHRSGPASLKALGNLLKYLLEVLKVSEGGVVRALKDLVGKLANSPYMAEFIRFVVLGSFIETGRQLGQSVMDWVQHLFVVEATFVRGDFAYDWVSRYLADKHTWSESRVFQVIVQNPLNAHASAQSSSYEDDAPGRPKQLYQPNPGSPVFFKWKNHWITIVLGKAETRMSPALPSGSDIAQNLTLRVWSRNRRILDDFVEEARQHYFSSGKPPRQLPLLPDPSRTVLTVRFIQGDRSYDWMLAWIRAQNVFDTAVHLEITTQPADMSADLSADTKDNKDRDKDVMSFRPASGTKQLVLWKDHWFQFDTNFSSDLEERRWGPPGGGSTRGVLDVTVHSSDRTIIMDLVRAAREDYAKLTMSKVTVHMADANGSWLSSTSKTRRALSTLFLPEGTKEMLLNDMEEFLRSKDWYAWGGVPHRRGYLLYGEPGTGKSSTIHALASVLGLEIYYIQLSSRGLDDYQLQRLFNNAPQRSILLLEDIDCAFQADDEDSSDASKQQPFLVYGGSRRVAVRGGGRVTFSGLLNCLDGVISGEGRFVFATTNHIEKLDPALMRPGRMDIKIEYKLASKYQIYQTFLRFFLLPTLSGSGATVEDLHGDSVDPTAEPDAGPTEDAVMEPIEVIETEHASGPKPNGDAAANASTTAEVEDLATTFASLVPEYKYSIAQIQGFLIRKRNDPKKAIEDVEEWMKEQDEEKRMLEEKRREKEREKTEKKKEKEKEDEKSADADSGKGGASGPTARAFGSRAEFAKEGGDGIGRGKVASTEETE